MEKPIFSGVCTALVTPFLDGRVNYPMMEMLLRRQIDAGVKTVVISGTTGESPTLTESEKLELFRRCKAYAGNDCMIIAGTGSNNTAHAAQLSIAAQEAGADALLVVTPYYNKATSDGLFAHYLTIAHSVSIPLIVYNVPGRTSVDIPVSTCRKLSAINNIAGIKEASSDITKITKIKASCHSGFGIWSGNDDQIVPVMSLGGNGVISVLSNVVPAQTQIMVNAALQGDFATAATIQCALQPLVELLFCEVNPIPVKAAMRLIGYDCGSCRLPLTDLSPEKANKLKTVLAEL